MKISSLVVALCAAASISGAADNENANMRVRFINAVPGSASVTLSAGTTPLFSGVKFGQVTAWKPLAQEQESKLIMRTSDGRKIETNEEFNFKNDNGDYTIVVMPAKDSNSPYVQLYGVDRKTPDATKGTVSVINATVSVKSAQLYIDDAKISGGINYAELKGPDDVAPGNHVFKAVNADDNDTVIGTKTLDTAGGKSYTAIIMGPKEFEVVDDSAPQTSGKPGSISSSPEELTSETSTLDALTSASTGVGSAMTTTTY